MIKTNDLPTVSSASLKDTLVANQTNDKGESKTVNIPVDVLKKSLGDLVTKPTKGLPAFIIEDITATAVSDIIQVFVTLGIIQQAPELSIELLDDAPPALGTALKVNLVIDPADYQYPLTANSSSLYTIGNIDSNTNVTTDSNGNYVIASTGKNDDGELIYPITILNKSKNKTLQVIFGSQGINILAQNFVNS